MAWTSSWRLRDSGLPLNVRPSTAPAFSGEDRRRQQRRLSAAAMSGDLDLLQELLSGKNKADPGQPGANGLTPLHMVCFSTCSAFAPSPEPDEVHLSTIAHHLTPTPHLAGVPAREQAAKAAGAQRFECAKALIDAGADVNAVSVALGLPLHMAARFAHPDIATLLIKSGAAVHVRDSSSFTPLHLALRAKSRDGVATAIRLLEAGAQLVDDPVGGPLPTWTRSNDGYDLEAVWAVLKAEIAPAGKKGKSAKGKGGKKKK